MSAVDDLPVFGNIDKSEIQPIHQKRILAFVNKFIVSTVSFLNNFVVECETKFVNYETKLQNVESSLKILESKLSSVNIPNGATTIAQVQAPVPDDNQESESSQQSTKANEDVEIQSIKNEETNAAETTDTPDGVRAAEHSLYQKYFKMMQFGVPAIAVKLKMTAEGVDAAILDDPNKIMTDDTRTTDTE